MTWIWVGGRTAVKRDRKNQSKSLIDRCMIYQLRHPEMSIMGLKDMSLSGVFFFIFIDESIKYVPLCLSF